MTRPTVRPLGSSAATMSKEAARLLTLLEEAEAWAAAAGERWVVNGRRRGVSLQIGTVAAAAGAELLARGSLMRQPGQGRADRYVISPDGRSALRRRSGPDADFGAQHREIDAKSVDLADGRQSVSVNAAESPLVWLRRRQGRDGRPLIDDAGFEAGERLRRDLERAGMVARLGIDWTRLQTAGEGGGLTLTEAMVGARQRVAHALAAVGPELSGLLVDLCGFLKGLETIERERGWPARSAKVAIGMALAALARHYGITNAARGPEHGRTRSWREQDQFDSRNAKSA